MELDSGTSGVHRAQRRSGGRRRAQLQPRRHASIVYTSTNANQDGRLGVGTADLYTVPVRRSRRRRRDARSRAPPMPDSAEYYPAFSPDDELVAFNRLPQSDASVTPTGQPYDGGMYFNPAAEIWVVPAAGGTAIRLRGQRSARLHAAGAAQHARLSEQDRLGQLVGQVVARGRHGRRAASTTG